MDAIVGLPDIFKQIRLYVRSLKATLTELWSRRTRSGQICLIRTKPKRTCCSAKCVCAGLIVLFQIGCDGKSLVDDNPVFTEAPPRISAGQTKVADNRNVQSGIRGISQSQESQELTGNSVVAEVNGSPIFVDDLIGSLRLELEADPSISAEQRQQVLYAQVRGRLNNYVEQEIVIQALNIAVPSDRQALIEESLEEPFQDVVQNIKSDNNVETDEQLNEVLNRQGLSIDLLRESFFRIQKVQGYLSTIATPPEAIDRADIVEFYARNRSDFTTPERVRWQEIVVDFASHGGRDGAEEQMISAVEKLQAGADFAEVAVKHSDALSAEKRGDMGWLVRGNLADKDLEKQLFNLSPGKMTQVFVREDRFEVFRVVDHQAANTAALQEVQQQIEQQIKGERLRQSRTSAMEKLREKATVVTIFDDETEEPKKTVVPAI